MTFCGIDFGTSNSAIAVAHARKIILAPVEGDATTLPSAIFFPHNARPLYGRMAQQTFFDGHAGRFMRSLKRILGTDLMNYGTIVNDRPRRFDDLIGGFVAHLKTAGEAACGQPLTQVVMGRPVHFVDGDPDADHAAETQLRRIAQAAGFQDIAFQYEPIAAAFAHERRLARETLALVADVGGGTSDFTVIRIGGHHRDKTGRKEDILANSGIRTGGNDFDKSFSLAAFMPHLGYLGGYGTQGLHFPRAPFHDLSEWSKVNQAYAPRTVAELRAACATAHDRAGAHRLMRVLEDELGHRLLAAVEDSKITLSHRHDIACALDFIMPGFTLPATRAQLIEAITPHIGDIIASLDDCLTQAGVKAADIAVCVLTGGPTAMPALADALMARLPRAQVSDGNRLSSVASGLGYAAQRLFAPIS